MLTTMRLLTCFTLFGICLLCQAAQPSKLGVCASCHGFDGIAKQNEYPNLAGQSQNYLLKQLLDYQNKTRESAIMQAFVLGLSEKEMQELSKYYSKLPQKTSPRVDKNSKSGEVLYKVGNRSKGLAACIACHGPKGQGNDPAKYPKISQQQGEYLKLQLEAFKQQTRTNDPKAIMRTLSKHLDEDDIKKLVLYLEHLS